MVVPRMQTVLDERLGDDVQLLGYDGDLSVIRPGSSAELTLYWRALGRIDVSYSVFVHLVDEQGRIWAQDDHVPAKGDAPTTSWLPGEVIADRVLLHVPANLPGGRYTLLVGLYDGNVRLPLRNGRDAVRLGELAL